MARELEIIIDALYTLDGDIYQLVGMNGNYFTLIPIRVKDIPHTSADGYVVMKAIQFSRAELYKGDLL